MINKLLQFLTLVVLSAYATSLFADVDSLRGKEIEDKSKAAEVKTYFKDRLPLARDYLQQPPLIPHKVEGYTVNIKFNKCLSCHSWQNYKRHDATKISQTHFANREGAVMSKVSGGRYFCLQCHVPQVDAKPLVENDFTPVESMKIK